MPEPASAPARASRTAARTALLMVAALALGCSGVTEVPVQAPAGEQPSVILILVDTLRRDHLGAYGYHRPTSPNIDGLAADAVLFTRCSSQAPWTTPSVASMLTSLPPSGLDIHNVPNGLKDEFLLLPEILQEHGYATGAVVSHDFLGSRWNFDQGFDDFDEDLAQGHAFVSSPQVTDRAIAFVDRHKNEPFFLLAHYFDPHHLYQEHEGFRFTEELDYRGELSSQTPLRRLNRMAAGEIAPPDLEYLVALYDSEIAFTDHHIGRLLSHLRTAGLYERALIVFTADHGEEFLDHGSFGHTTTLYEELIGVPLLVKIPGAEGGRVAGENVGLVDLMPTILDVAGIRPPEGLTGRSLVAGGEEERPVIVFSETSRREELRGAIGPELKLIYDLRRGGEQLFDLKADPLEREDLAGSGPPEAADLAAALEGWLRRYPPGEGQPRMVPLDDSDRDRLRALGYVD
jgi:arylsulfatase A-like enzyme